MATGKTDPVVIGGVPEHFNFPWQLTLDALEPGHADWREYSTGTGAMLADLIAGELDVAMLLTEGAALGLASGLPIEPVCLYTTSPLTWGVHVPPDSDLRSLAGLRGRRFAISRPGSGSHLMSLALALDQGWPVTEQTHVVVDNLPGALEAFAERRADVFLWEHFTTQPWVDAGDFRRVGDFVSPWPAWVVCASHAAWQTRREDIETLIGQAMDQAARLKAKPDTASRIAVHYKLADSEVTEWLALTEWAANRESPEAALAAARRMLEAAGQIPASAAEQH